MPQRSNFPATVTPKIAFGDRLFANTTSFGSAVISFLHWNPTANTDAPTSIPVRWRHVGKPAESLDAKWLQYEGDDLTSSLPKSFIDAAVILIDRQTLDDHIKYKSVNAIPSVAYKLGTAVMAGSSEKYPILGLENEDDDTYKLAMGIGPGPLEVCVGSSTRVPRGHIFEPLTDGIEAGPIVPIADLPEHIPFMSS